MSTQTDSIDVKTFGCKVNTYDASLLQKTSHLQAGVTDWSQIHVVNTCAVTKEATREAIRHINRFKRNHPEKTLVVTGCSAQVDGELLDGLDSADLIIANSHKGQFHQLVTDHLQGKSSTKVHRSNIFRHETLGQGGGLKESHTRSFLKIQDGCNSFCSFCIIPYARGKSRSLSVSHLVERVKELFDQGYREVVLTGIHIGDYEDPETGAGLSDLVQAVLEQTEMPRFRLGSLEPLEINDHLFELYKDSRMCSHFHMSIQSAQSEVLKGMKRVYTAKDVEMILNKIDQKISGAFVGMDVIVGFPGEDEEKYHETKQRLQNLPWTKLHVFPYSERPGTRAALSESSVDWVKRKQRSAEFREMSLERYQMRALNQVGATKRVLLTHSSANKGVRGLSRDYWSVMLPEEISVRAKEVSVKIEGFDPSQKKESALLGRLHA